VGFNYKTDDCIINDSGQISAFYILTYIQISNSSLFVLMEIVDN
jgi:hypothetical protein